MKTIDELLSQIAKNTGAALSAPPKKKAEPELKARTVTEKKSVLQFEKKPYLPLYLAKEIIYCVEKGAEREGVSAVISIVNDNGRLIAFEAMDNSFLASISASQDKAYTAAALRMPTEKALAESRGGKFDGLSNGNGILLLGGGNPFFVDDSLVGAIGVSGGTKEQDIELAKLGTRYLNERIKYLKEVEK